MTPSKKITKFKFCSFAANMCKSAEHFSVQQHFMLKSQLADARKAAISSSEQHAQPKHHEKQNKKTTRCLLCDGARGRETFEL
jgi:hypothetical protein